MANDLPPVPADDLLADVWTSRNFGFRRCALAMLIDVHGRFFGQQRDNKPDIAQPGRVGFFGGGLEGNEIPIEAAVREIEEETNLRFPPESFEPLTAYFAWRPLTSEYEAVCPYALTNIDSSHLEIFEGQNAIEITDMDDPGLASTVLPALRECFSLYK